MTVLVACLIAFVAGLVAGAWCWYRFGARLARDAQVIRTL